MIRGGCHNRGWVVLVPGVLVLVALPPTPRRRRTPSSSPDCPGRVSRPVQGRRRPPGLTRTCPAEDRRYGPTRRGTDRHDREPTAGRSALWPHGELVRHARRPVRRRDRSAHEPLAVLPGSDQRRPPPDFPLRTQVRLLRDHRGREAPRLGGAVRQPPRGEPFRGEHQPRRRLPGSCQLRPRVPQAGGKRLGPDQHADRAVPGPRFRRHLRQAQRRRRRQHPPVPGRQRHQSLHE